MPVPEPPAHLRTPAVRLLFWFLNRRDGAVPSPLHAYAWRPAIMFAFLRLGRAVRRRGKLPERLKRLAMYWTARQVECPL